MAQAKRDFHLQKNEIRFFSFTLYRLKSETLKRLEENTGDALQAIRVGNCGLNRTPSAWEPAPRIHRWSYMKTKSSIQQRNTQQDKQTAHKMETKSLAATLRTRANIQNWERTPEIKYQGNKTAISKWTEKKVFKQITVIGEELLLKVFNISNPWENAN